MTSPELDFSDSAEGIQAHRPRFLGHREVPRYVSARRFAAKRRGSAEYLDFADRRAKYVGMIIIALDQQYRVEGHLQIGG